MAPEDQQRIFEEFQQIGHGLAGKTEGTGLGLAFCREALKAMKGSLSVESEPGEGARLPIRLPISD